MLQNLTSGRQSKYHNRILAVVRRSGSVKTTCPAHMTKNTNKTEPPTHAARQEHSLTASWVRPVPRQSIAGRTQASQAVTDFSSARTNPVSRTPAGVHQKPIIAVLLDLSASTVLALPVFPAVGAQDAPAPAHRAHRLFVREARAPCASDVHNAPPVCRIRAAALDRTRLEGAEVDRS